MNEEEKVEEDEDRDGHEPPLTPTLSFYTFKRRKRKEERRKKKERRRDSEWMPVEWS